MASPYFADRDEAGRALGEYVAKQLSSAPPRAVAPAMSDAPGPGRPLVLALPRGGVPVAARVAEAIDGHLDIVVARKIGAPGHAEFGIGAVAEDGPPVFDGRSLRQLGLREDDLAEIVQRERAEVRRRVARYRGDRPLPDPTGRIVVVVDDGLATGVTARATLRWLHRFRPHTLLLAAPVGSPQARQDLRSHADDVICLHAPAGFRAVGQYYDDFRQLSDADVDQAMAGVSGRRSNAT